MGVGTTTRPRIPIEITCHDSYGYTERIYSPPSEIRKRVKVGRPSQTMYGRQHPRICLSWRLEIWLTDWAYQKDKELFV